MKKLVSMLLVVMFCFASLGAAAAEVPSFMEKRYNNYTADYKISMKINNAQEIAGFLKELDTEQIDRFIDIRALIESLFEVNSVLNVEAEISEDFRKVAIGVTTETNQSIVLNRNYTNSYCAKTGLWLKMDVDKKELIFVYSTPFNEKYAVIDFTKNAPQKVKDEIFGMYDKTFSRDFMEKHNNEIIKLAAQHADVSVNGKTATLHYDNDSFIAFIEATVEYMKKLYGEMALTVEGEAMEFPEIPSLDGIKLLGKEGITCTFNLSEDTITGYSEKCDISIGLAEIYTRISGQPWEFISSGDINLTVETSGTVSKVGTTKVEFPALTEENSFEIIEENDEYYDEEDDEPYIYYDVYGETDIDTFDGERYYLPIRDCIEYAYEDCSVITYDKGAVTITTNTGIEGRDINASFKVGEDVAIVNGVTYSDFGAFKMIDGKVHASAEFYEKCLGWKLVSLDKDLINGTIYYEFYTSENEPYDPYISYGVYGEIDIDTFDGERYYLPIRDCIEYAYEDCSVITYDKGAVTITTNTGIEGRDINASFKVGEDVAIVNGVTYSGFGTFKMIDGKVYASVEFYKECLGWTLGYLEKDLINGGMYYELYTSEDYSY